MKRTLAALALATALAGCPIPQPLPDYPAGTITPPRILTQMATSDAQSILVVPAGCATRPQYVLNATIFYQDSVMVEARWFVDYKQDNAVRRLIQNTNRQVPPDPNPLILNRAVPPFTFSPYDFTPPAELGLATTATGSSANVVHVVELVVSNGFDPDPAAPEPNRTPAVVPQGGARFEIQNYRWVFVNVPPTTTGCPGAPGCCP